MDRESLLALYKTEADALPDVSVKGAKMPYTAVNGNMFSFLSPEDALCLRFDEARRAELAEAFGTGPVLQYGAVMKGYVEVPQSALGDLPALLAESFAFASTLKPKATKR